MATLTYSFDLDPTFKSVFIHDDVTLTTTVEVRNKASNVLTVTAPLSLWQSMGRNIVEWQTLRSANDLISFLRV